MSWNLACGKRIRWAIGLAGAIVFSIVATGCGPAMGDVSGTVTIGDKPLPGGTITFVSADGKGAGQTGTIDENGKFSMKAPVGECLVSIDNRSLIEGPALVGSGGAAPKGDAGAGAPKMPGMPGKGPAAKKDGPVVAPPDPIKKAREEKGAPASGGSAQRPKGTYVAIPSNYYDQTTSGLKFTVKSGSNPPFDIKLTGTGGGGATPPAGGGDK